jgi:DNA-directed RNA polymerase subunit M/transcription elongation factor TFIIS
MVTLTTVLLSIKGDVRKTNLQLNNDGVLTIDILQKYFKKKEVPEKVCYYEYDDKLIFIFGYKKGKKGTENKIQLPEPYTSTVLYGDAIVLVSINDKWESPIPFTVDQWNKFYNSELGEEENKEDDSENEDEDNDIISEEEGGSVKDDFEDNNSESSIILEDDAEVEEVLPPVKKKRAPVYGKVDSSILKEEISIDSGPESHKFRLLCLNALKFLESDFEENDIKMLEKTIYENTFNISQKNYIPRTWKSLQFCELYKQNVRMVISNIHPESPVKNPRLLNRVRDDEFKLYEIANMSSYEMYPEKWFELKDKLIQREQKILEGNKSRATDQFKCRRCNKRECTYYELQTRSADEPMTIFITCLNCGKEWRQGG